MGKKKQQRKQQRQAQRRQQQQQQLEQASAICGGPADAFLTLVNQRVALGVSGNVQSACETIREAVQAAPSVWILHRFFAHSEFLIMTVRADFAKK
jgi:hypothetical protein